MVDRRQVSSGRKAAFYLGYLSFAAGAALAVWVVAGPWHFTPSGLWAESMRSIAAVCCIGLGVFLRRVGIRGLAGSLVVLDPPRAREDLEPWSRAAGGLLDAALSEAPALKEIASARSGAKPTEAPAVKVRCGSCGALSDEEASFCSRCGRRLGPSEPDGRGSGR